MTTSVAEAEAKRPPVSSFTFFNRQPLYLRPDPSRVVVRPFRLASEPRDLNPTDWTRAQHIVEVIQPALAEGRIVLCDRFTDSTEAYQGGGRKLGSEAVLALHRVLCGNLWPELTILMDSDVAMSVDRARRRNKSAGKNDGTRGDENRFEQESRAFFGRVRNSYLAIAAREPQRVIVVDARGTPEETHRQIVKVVGRKLKLAAKTA